MHPTMNSRTLQQRTGPAFLLLALGFLAGCGKTPAHQIPEASVVEIPKPEVLPVTARIDEPKKGETTPDPKPVAKEEPKAEPVEPGKSFAFPGDSGGKLLSTLLTPKVPVPMTGRTVVAPRERSLPAFLDNASVLVPDAASNPPTLRVPASREIRPMSLPEKVAPDFAPAIPSLPPLPPLEVGSLHKQPTRDPAQPADLPVLSNKPVPERASLADPTVEFTAQSVISLVLPLRETTVPFVKLTIPEPFEFAGQPAPKVVPADDANKFLSPPPAPKP